MAEEKDVDQISGVETTGHEWDGIKELDMPLPRWWLYTFYICIVWGVAYTIAFPAWPMISEATSGALGYSSRQEVMQDIADHRESQSAYVEQISGMEIEEIAADGELMQFAQAGGSAIFKTYCSQCHGAGAQGAVGYPNLNDDAWLWGGTREAIYQTVAHGVRWEGADETRYSEMPAFGRDELLSEEEIAAVAEYVYALSNSDADAALAEAGAEVFEYECVACHGEDGTGMVDLGAPNLTDAIWLYGGDRETIIATVTNSRFGQMPNWLGRLTEAEVKQVALYVHSLGGGQAAEE